MKDFDYGVDEYGAQISREMPIWLQAELICLEEQVRIQMGVTQLDDD